MIKPVPSDGMLVGSGRRNKSIAIIMAAVLTIASVATIFLITRGGMPVYPGASKREDLSVYYEQALENLGFKGLELAVYDSRASTSAIASWYYEQMSKQGWAKENEWTDPSNEISCALYKSGDKGAIIWAGTEARGYFGIITGEWENVMKFWTNLRGVFYVPQMEWRAAGLSKEFMEAIEWIKENIPTNAVFSIQWSFGSIFTGTTGRKAVVGDVEVMALEGEWENNPSLARRPPDYIYYVEGNQVLIYGVEVPRKSFLTNLDNWVDDLGEKPGSFEINGRRIDVQYFPIVGENEFRWLVTTYRDNYGVKIDYVIFSYDELASADSYYRTTLPLYVSLNADRIKTPSGLRPTLEDQIYVFNFGENREAVVLDHLNQRAYLRASEENSSLDGYGFLRVDREGKISDFLSFYPPSSPGDIPETLLIFLDDDGNIVTAWLVKGVSAKYLERPVPMALRVWFGDISDIGYLQVAFSSSNGLVKVAKINHVPSLISPANGARINDNAPELTWYGAVGASRYELLVDNDASFSSPLIQNDNVTGATYTATVELSDGEYHWKVAAYDTMNNLLGWSDSSTFTVDTQVPV